MRSVVVVLPASMWATIPMLRIEANGSLSMGGGPVGRFGRRDGAGGVPSAGGRSSSVYRRRVGRTARVAARPRQREQPAVQVLQVTPPEPPVFERQDEVLR